MVRGSWSARAATSPLPADLAGRAVAATPGTDPYFFLVQTLAEADLGIGDIELQPLQHADGRSALEGGSVDAWSGLDPIMGAAEVESGAQLVYRNVDFNTYGFLNATEDFIDNHADVAQVRLAPTSRPAPGRSRTSRRPHSCSPTRPASTSRSPPP